MQFLSIPHLVFKEAVVQVAVEPLPERNVGLLPVDGVGEVQRGARCHLTQLFCRQIHLDDLFEGAEGYGEGNEQTNTQTKSLIQDIRSMKQSTLSAGAY